MDHRAQPPQYQKRAPGGQYGYGRYNLGYSAPPKYPPQQYGSTSATNVVVQRMDRGAVGVRQEAPVDYTTQAYIAFLCCFWPTGIMAILKAREARDAVAVGDMARAHSSANSASSMIGISYGVGIVSFFIVIAIVCVAIIMSAHN